MTNFFKMIAYVFFSVIAIVIFFTMLKFFLILIVAMFLFAFFLFLIGYVYLRIKIDKTKENMNSNFNSFQSFVNENDAQDNMKDVTNYDNQNNKDDS